MTILFILACGIVALLVFIMFIILKKTVNAINSQTKTYFVDKLQAYDSLIDEKEQRLNEIDVEITKVSDSFYDKIEEANYVDSLRGNSEDIEKVGDACLYYCHFVVCKQL